MFLRIVIRSDYKLSKLLQTVMSNLNLKGTTLKLRLHAAINRVRSVFWRIKMSAGAIVHCRFVKKDFKCDQLNYTCLFCAYARKRIAHD
jgi:hypothetical protein